MQWSKNQQQAIDARNRRILVSAAAGSGKTAVLVGRIIERILDKEHPADVGNLLIMTFTRAAARQMKERIASALEKALHTVEYQSAVYKRLKRQIALLDCANISTIDSFCKEIIEENPDKANLDPGFVIADEESLSLMKEDILENLMEEEYEKADPAFMDLVAAFSTTRSDGKIKNHIKLVYQSAQTSAWPEEWYKKQEDFCGFAGGKCEKKDNDRQEKDSLWIRKVSHLIHTVLKDIVSDMDAAICLCNSTDGPLAYLDAILAEKSMVLSMLDTSDYETLSRLLSSMEFERLGRVAKGVDADLKERAKGIRDQYKKNIKSLQEKYIFSMETVRLQETETAKYIMELIRLAKEFDKRFHMEKQRKNQVDFNDLEHLALKLLYGFPEIAADYREKFDEIYVDEYQDSNFVQEELIRAIEKNNVFMVGDVKQSIYGFRQAKPELFTSKYNAYEYYEGNEDADSDVKIDLSTNFRSRSSVLESINALFYRIMDTSLGGISYDEAAALHTGASYEDVRGERSTADCPEIMLLDVLQDEEISEELEDSENIELEAKMIALRIRELKESLLVRDDNGENRRLKYSDIVILLRSQANRAENMAQILVNYGIPAYAQTGTGYFDTFEIRKILAVLTVIDNPYRDIAFCAYLHSPMAKITDEELTEISAQKRAASGQTGMRRLYSDVKEYMKNGENEKLRQKLGKAMETLSLLRELSVTEPLTKLLRSIYEITGFYDFCAASSSGNVRSANLDVLLEKAERFMKSGYQGVFHFVRYIENLKKYSTDFGEAGSVGEFDDTVRIMTIHKSKGLEFPVCILANANKRFNETDLRTDILIDDDLGIACKYVNTELRVKSETLKKQLIAYKKKTDNIAEELRVLYVAMTRAKEKLIITGTVKDFEKYKKKYSHVDAGNDSPLSFLNIREAGSYLDWLMMCYEGISGHFRLKVCSQEYLIADEVKEQIRQITDADYLHGILPTEPDEEIQSRINFVYPYENDVNRKATFSISELKRIGQFADEAQSALLFSEKPDETRSVSAQRIASTDFSGTRKGNLYHRVMELLDFRRTDTPEQLREQVQEMIQSKKISEDANDISREKIRNLFSGPIGKLLKQAEQEGTLYREQSFIMGIPANELNLSDSEERILIRGIVDAFAETKDGLLLVDYKTDRLHRPKDFIERYHVQLHFYKRALEMSFRKPVIGMYIYSFEMEEWIAVPETSLDYGIFR